MNDRSVAWERARSTLLLLAIASLAVGCGSVRATDGRVFARSGAGGAAEGGGGLPGLPAAVGDVSSCLSRAAQEQKRGSSR